MFLEAHLKDVDLSLKDFGLRIGVSGETVRRYITGERFPGPDEMDLIEHHTGGAVTYGDFMLRRKMRQALEQSRKTKLTKRRRRTRQKSNASRLSLAAAS